MEELQGKNNKKQHFGDRLQKLGFWGLPEPKKAQGAPGARNGQFAKENVIEKQHFGDRLQKLGFWGPALARKEPQEITCQVGDPLWNFRGIDRQKHWRIAHSTTRVLEKGSNLIFTNEENRQEG